MLDLPLKKLTADEAVNLGLIDAIKNGEAKIAGVYTIDKNCKVDFTQRNFFFTTKNDEVILAKFANNYEVFHFWELLGSESVE